MTRLLPSLLLLLLTTGQATEYERAVSLVPPSLLVGGCHNPGSNPNTEEQDATRRLLIDKYSWSIVTALAADRMATFIGDRGVVDFGAGNGYVSYLLRLRGVDSLAVDNWSQFGPPPHTWHLVETGGLELLQGTSGRALLLSWPPKASPMAIQAVRAWGGDRLVYVGEIMRGTADPAFHRELSQNWHLVERIQIPQWRNRGDAIFLFERRDGDGDGWDWIETAMAECTYGRTAP